MTLFPSCVVEGEHPTAMRTPRGSNSAGEKSKDQSGVRAPVEVVIPPDVIPTEAIKIRYATSPGTSTTEQDDADWTSSDEDDEEEDSLTVLHKSCPQSTMAERRRFLEACDGDVDFASLQLVSYLEWRASNDLDVLGVAAQEPPQDGQRKMLSDKEDWHFAAMGAVAKVNATGQDSSPPPPESLPRLVSFHGDEGSVEGDEVLLGIDGTRLLQVLPAQLDSKLATPSTYALAVAMYLDRKLDRHSMEKVTVVIDVRGGTGWANPYPTSVLPFIKDVSRILGEHFPERLSKCIIFPLPRTATWIWNLAKVFLNEDTASKIEICPGPARDDSPVPAQLHNFLDAQAIDAMEERRTSSFVG